MNQSFLRMFVAGALLAGLSTFAGAEEEVKDSRNPHAQLKRLVGKWATEMTSVYPDPNKPQVTKGRADFRMILGGNFVQQRYFGEIDGKKYQGIGISGYDTAKKKYVGTWKDSLNTGIMHTEGAYDPQTHTLTETGKMSSPEGEMETKNTTKYVDDDHFVFTMYMVAPDGEHKLFSIDYTRSKPEAKPKSTKGAKSVKSAKGQ